MKQRIVYARQLQGRMGPVTLRVLVQTHVYFDSYRRVLCLHLQKEVYA